VILEDFSIYYRHKFFMAHLFNVGTNELLPKKKQPKIADAIPILVYIVCKGTLKKKATFVL
jgi:hypothetical protein